MTQHQLHLFNGVYLVVLVAIAVLTRASAKRTVGALIGGAAFGVVALGIIALGERVAWWHIAIKWEPSFLAVLLIDFALSCAALNLMTWRVARRFGPRGLAFVVVVAAVLGPVRDYRYMATFPEWGSYAPGVAPVLAISATYIVLVVLGYGVMRLVAGPAHADRLARRRRPPNRPLQPSGGAGAPD